MQKYLKDNKNKTRHLTSKISNNICPWTLSVPRRSYFFSSFTRKTVRFLEQIMSEDKYQWNVFAPNGGYCLFNSTIYLNFAFKKHWRKIK